RSSGSDFAPHSTSSALTALARSVRESINVPSRSNTIRRDGCRVLGAGCWVLVPGALCTILGAMHGTRRYARYGELCTVLGERRRRFPDCDPHDRHARFPRLIEDQLRDALHGRITVDDVDRLAELRERRDERVVVAQDHLVVELAIDPALHDALDVAEIADHVAVVERAGAYFDLGDRVVSMRMLADAVVVEQAVAVAEVDALGNGIHSEDR